MKPLWMLALLCALAGTGFGAVPRVGWQPHPGAQLPLDLQFRDERGKLVSLREYFDGRPVVLVLGYVGCRGLCSQVWQGAREVLQELPKRQGGVLLGVSIDPREEPRTIRDADATGAAASWPMHRLTDWQGSAARLAHAVGFEFEYHADIDQYAHPAGLIVISGRGRIRDYLQGVRFDANRLGPLLNASAVSPQPAASAPVPALLLCFHFDPTTGRYSLAIMRVLAVLGLMFIGAGAAWWWHEWGRA